MDTQEISEAILEHFTTLSTFAIWDSLCKTHKWLYNSLLMQLTGHAYFPSGNLDHKFHTWIFETPILLHKVTSTTGILPFSTLLPSSTVSFMDQWRYQQLSMFKSLSKPLRSLADLTLLETPSLSMINHLRNPSSTSTRRYCH